MSKRERVKAGIGNAISNAANVALLSLGAKDEQPERAEEVVVTREIINDFDAEGFARAVVGINRKIAKIKDAPAAARLQLLDQLIPNITEVRANFIAGCRSATLRMYDFKKARKKEGKDLSIKLVRMGFEKLSILIQMEDSLIPCCTYLEILHALVMYQFAWNLEKKRKDANKVFGDVKIGNAKGLEEEVVTCRRFIAMTRATIKRAIDRAASKQPWTLIDQGLESVDVALRGIPDGSVEDKNLWVDLAESINTNALSVACMRVNEALIERIAKNAVVAMADYKDAVDQEAERESKRETLLKKRAMEVTPNMFILETRKQDMNIRLGGGSKSVDDLKFLIRQLQLATLGPILRPQRVRHIEELIKKPDAHHAWFSHSDQEEWKNATKKPSQGSWSQEDQEEYRKMRAGMRVRIIQRELQLGISEWANTKPWEIIAAWAETISSLLLDASSPSAGKLPDEMMNWLVLGDMDYIYANMVVHDPLIGMNQLSQLGDSQENNIFTNQVIGEVLDDNEESAERRKKAKDDLKNNYVDKLQNNPLWKLSQLAQGSVFQKEDGQAGEDAAAKEAQMADGKTPAEKFQDAHKWLLASSENILRYIVDESDELKGKMNSLYGQSIHLKKLTQEADNGRDPKGLFKVFFDAKMRCASLTGKGCYECCKVCGGRSMARLCGGCMKSTCGACAGLVCVTCCSVCLCPCSTVCTDRCAPIIVSTEPSQHMIHISYNLDVMGFSFRDARDSAMAMRGAFPRIGIQIPLLNGAEAAGQSKKDGLWMYSQSGKFLACASLGRLVVREIPKHFGEDVMDKEITTEDQKDIVPTCMSISQDDKLIAVGTDRHGVLLFKNDGKRGKLLKKLTITGHKSKAAAGSSGAYPRVSCVAFTPSVAKKGAMKYFSKAETMCFYITENDTDEKVTEVTAFGKDRKASSKGTPLFFYASNLQKEADQTFQATQPAQEKKAKKVLEPIGAFRAISFKPILVDGNMFFVAAGEQALAIFKFSPHQEGNLPAEGSVQQMYKISDGDFLSCQWPGPLIVASGSERLEVWDVSSNMMTAPNKEGKTKSGTQGMVWDEDFLAVNVDIGGLDSLNLDQKGAEVAMCCCGGFEDSDGSPQLLGVVVRINVEAMINVEREKSFVGPESPQQREVEREGESGGGQTQENNQKVVMIRIRKPDGYARKNAKLGTSSNFYAVYQRKFEPNRKVMALTFGTGKNRTLSWLLEDDSGMPPPKPLYLEHELKGCAPSFCRPICGGWPEPCCFPGCCPGKGCLPGCFPCCGCGPDGRCCYGGDMCRHTCPTGGLVPLEDEDGKRIENVRAAKYEDFKRRLEENSSYAEMSARRTASIPRRVATLIKEKSEGNSEAMSPSKGNQVQDLGLTGSPRTPRKYGSIAADSPVFMKHASTLSYDGDDKEVKQEVKLVAGQMDVDYIGVVEETQGSCQKCCWKVGQCAGCLSRWKPKHIMVETQQQMIGKVKTDLAWNKRTSERLNRKLWEERKRFVGHVTDTLGKVSSTRDGVMMFGLLTAHDFTGSDGQVIVRPDMMSPDRHALPRSEILKETRVSIYKCARDLNLLMDALRRMSRDFFTSEGKRWDKHVKDKKRKAKEEGAPEWMKLEDSYPGHISEELEALKGEAVRLKKKLKDKMPKRDSKEDQKDLHEQVEHLKAIAMHEEKAKALGEMSQRIQGEIEATKLVEMEASTLESRLNSMESGGDFAEDVETLVTKSVGAYAGVIKNESIEPIVNMYEEMGFFGIPSSTYLNKELENLAEILESSRMDSRVGRVLQSIQNAYKVILLEMKELRVSGRSAEALGVFKRLHPERDVSSMSAEEEKEILDDLKTRHDKHAKAPPPQSSGSMDYSPVAKDLMEIKKSVLDEVDRGMWWFPGEIMPAPVVLNSDHPKLARLAKRDLKVFKELVAQVKEARRDCSDLRMWAYEYSIWPVPGDAYTRDKAKKHLHDYIFLGDDPYYTLANVLPNEDERKARLSAWEKQDKEKRVHEKMYVAREQLKQLKDLAHQFLAQLKVAVIWHRMARATIKPDQRRTQAFENHLDVMKGAIAILCGGGQAGVQEGGTEGLNDVPSGASGEESRWLQKTIKGIEHTIARSEMSNIKRKIVMIRGRADDDEHRLDEQIRFTEDTIKKLKDEWKGMSTEKSLMLKDMEEMLQRMKEQKQQIGKMIGKMVSELESEAGAERGGDGVRVQGADSMVVEEEEPVKGPADGGIDAPPDARDSVDGVTPFKASSEETGISGEGSLAGVGAGSRAADDDADVDVDGNIADVVGKICSEKQIQEMTKKLDDTLQRMRMDDTLFRLKNEGDDIHGLPRHVVVEFRDEMLDIMQQLSQVEDKLDKSIKALRQSLPKVEKIDLTKEGGEATDAVAGAGAVDPNGVGFGVGAETQAAAVGEGQGLAKAEEAAKKDAEEKEKEKEQGNPIIKSLTEALQELKKRKNKAKKLLEETEKELTRMEEPKGYDDVKELLAKCSSKILSLLSWYELSLQRGDWGMHDVDFPESPWERIEAQVFIDLEDVCSLLFLNVPSRDLDATKGRKIVLHPRDDLTAKVIDELVEEKQRSEQAAADQAGGKTPEDATAGKPTAMFMEKNAKLSQILGNTPIPGVNDSPPRSPSPPDNDNSRHVAFEEKDQDAIKVFDDGTGKAAVDVGAAGAAIDGGAAADGGGGGGGGGGAAAAAAVSGVAVAAAVGDSPSQEKSVEQEQVSGGDFGSMQQHVFGGNMGSNGALNQSIDLGKDSIGGSFHRNFKNLKKVDFKAEASRLAHTSVHHLLSQMMGEMEEAEAEEKRIEDKVKKNAFTRVIEECNKVEMWLKLWNDLSSDIQDSETSRTAKSSKANPIELTLVKSGVKGEKVSVVGNVEDFVDKMSQGDMFRPYRNAVVDLLECSSLPIFQGALVEHFNMMSSQCVGFIEGELGDVSNDQKHTGVTDVIEFIESAGDEATELVGEMVSEVADAVSEAAGLAGGFRRKLFQGAGKVMPGMKGKPKGIGGSAGDVSSGAGDVAQAEGVTHSTASANGGMDGVSSDAAAPAAGDGAQVGDKEQVKAESKWKVFKKSRNWGEDKRQAAEKIGLENFAKSSEAASKNVAGRQVVSTMKLLLQERRKQFGVDYNKVFGKGKHDLLAMIRKVARDEELRPKEREEAWWEHWKRVHRRGGKDHEVERAMNEIKKAYNKTNAFLQAVNISDQKELSEKKRDLGKGIDANVVGDVAAGDDALALTSSEYNEKQLWKVRERALMALLGMHFDLYFSRKFNESHENHDLNEVKVLENIDKIITLRRTLEPDERVRKSTEEPLFAFDLRAAVTQKPPLEGRERQDMGFEVPPTFKKSLVQWLENRIDGLKDVYKENMGNQYTQQLIEEEKQGIKKQLEQTRKADSQEKEMSAGGGGRPSTSAGAVVGGGGGGGGRAGRAAAGKRLEGVAEDEEEQDDSSAGNEQEQVDDMFGDLVKEFEEVKTKLAETVDPNEARFNDLKELIQGIKNNQAGQENNLKEMKEDLVKEIDHRMRKQMGDTIRETIKGFGLDASIKESVAQAFRAGGGEEMDDAPIKRMNREVEKLTGRIERSNHQTKNMLAKNEAMLKLMGHSPMHWAKQDKMHGIKKKLSSLAKDQQRSARNVSPDFTKEGNESWTNYLTKVSDVSSQLDRLRMEMQLEMEEQRDALDEMHGMLVDEFQGTTIHLPKDVFKDTVINLPKEEMDKMMGLTRTKSRPSKSPENSSSWAKNHVAASPLNPRSGPPAPRGKAV